MTRLRDHRGGPRPQADDRNDPGLARRLGHLGRLVEVQCLNTNVLASVRTEARRTSPHTIT
jgi:hypothetical protein